MSLCYKWMILDNPLDLSECTPQKLNEYVVQPAEPQQYCLKVPFIPIVLHYQQRPPSKHKVELQLQSQLTVENNRVQSTLIEQLWTETHVYQLIRINNCEVYKVHMNLTLKITLKKPLQNRVKRLEKLVVHNPEVVGLGILMAPIIVNQPISIEYIYNLSGYIWVKLTANLESISVHKVELMQWLAKPSVPLLHQAKITTTFKYAVLSRHQCYGILFQICPDLPHLEVPCRICLQTPSYPCFQIIKIFEL